MSLLTPGVASAHVVVGVGGGGGFHAGWGYGGFSAGVAGYGWGAVVAPCFCDDAANDYFYYGPPPYAYVGPPPPPSFVRPEPDHPTAGMLGVTFGAGTDSLKDQTVGNLGGVQASLRYLADEHLALDASFGVLGHTANDGSSATDEPILGGAVLYLFGRRLLPYLEVAAGVDRQHIEWADGSTTEDSLSYLGEIGAGLELRLGRHIGLDADVRYDRRRLDKASGTPVVYNSKNVPQPGSLDPLLGTTSGVRTTFSLVVYF